MNNQIIPVITIDGPSGAGKGTVAQMLALDLGWNILDSGALYRSLAYYFEIEKIRPVLSVVCERNIPVFVKTVFW